MKNQYFGDINDYKKYGLLRAINRATSWRTLVAWYLTPDDGGSDGNKIRYLWRPKNWRAHDAELYDFLKMQIASGGQRSVSVIERSDQLSESDYYSKFTPDKKDARAAWFAQLIAAVAWRDLTFLDPDNGMEIRSVPIGRKNSSKYVAWTELSALWSLGTSLLLYQHFPWKKRGEFTAKMKGCFAERLSGSEVFAYKTAHVLFLLALQPRHSHESDAIRREVMRTWHQRLEEC